VAVVGLDAWGFTSNESGMVGVQRNLTAFLLAKGGIGYNSPLIFPNHEIALFRGHPFLGHSSTLAGEVATA
jgi:hypothetical protein